MAWHPEYLNSAASLTTQHLRDGLSHQDWVNQHEGMLSQIGFKYLSATVLAIDVQGQEATVTFKVRVSLVIGEVVQIERYTLRMREGQWLINEQQIEDDRVIEKTI